VIAFSLITYLHVLLGELVPKTLALQRAEQIALAVAAPMEAFLTLTRPLLFSCVAPAGLVLRLFGARDTRRGRRNSLARRTQADRYRQPSGRPDSRIARGDDPQRHRAR
jgi:CBS domain containing-hemolysin-like protein